MSSLVVRWSRATSGAAIRTPPDDIRARLHQRLAETGRRANERDVAFSPTQAIPPRNGDRESPDGVPKPGYVVAVRARRCGVGSLAPSPDLGLRRKLPHVRLLARRQRIDDIVNISGIAHPQRVVGGSLLGAAETSARTIAREGDTMP